VYTAVIAAVNISMALANGPVNAAMKNPATAEPQRGFVVFSRFWVGE